MIFNARLPGEFVSKLMMCAEKDHIGSPINIHE